MKKFITQLIKGIILSLLYLQITKANDTTIENITLFVSFYLAMIYGATITGIDENVITSAFLTKTVFSLVDERIKKNIQEYRLDFAINEVYEFFWSKFCDVYIEECKKTGDTKNLRPMLQKILVMMHPFAPFITEEIHTLLFEKQIIE